MISSPTARKGSSSAVPSYRCSFRPPIPPCQSSTRPKSTRRPQWTLPLPSSDGARLLPMGAGEFVQLRPLTPDDAGELLGVLDTDRNTFDSWLRWSSAIRSPENALDFIVSAERREQ